MKLQTEEKINNKNKKRMKQKTEQIREVMEERMIEKHYGKLN